MSKQIAPWWPPVLAPMRAPQQEWSSFDFNRCLRSAAGASTLVSLLPFGACALRATSRAATAATQDSFDAGWRFYHARRAMRQCPCMQRFQTSPVEGKGKGKGNNAAEEQRIYGERFDAVGDGIEALDQNDLEAFIKAAQRLLPYDLEYHDMSDLRFLHRAAIKGNYFAARWLLQHGATPLVQSWDSDTYGHGGWTPLHHAACNGDVRMCRLLLSAGANLDAGICVPARMREHGLTQDFRAGSRPVDMARSMGHTAVVEILQGWLVDALQDCPPTAPVRPPLLFQLRAAGCNAHALRLAGHSTEALLEAGFSICELIHRAEVCNFQTATCRCCSRSALLHEGWKGDLDPDSAACAASRCWRRRPEARWPGESSGSSGRPRRRRFRAIHSVHEKLNAEMDVADNGTTELLHALWDVNFGDTELPSQTTMIGDVCMDCWSELNPDAQELEAAEYDLKHDTEKQRVQRQQKQQRKHQHSQWEERSQHISRRKGRHDDLERVSR